ncbi:MAG: hypothetical protein ACI4U2_06570 [Christensenellaceae bacterium]
MKLAQKIRNGAIALLFAILLLIPIVSVILLSTAEQKAYLAGGVQPHSSVNYGDLISPTRMDFREQYSVSGVYEPYEVFFMDIAKETRLTVSVGEEVKKGDVIGYEGERAIVAEGNGILTECTESCLRFDSLDSAVLVCRLTTQVADRLFADGVELTTATGEVITPYSRSNRMEDGLVEVKLLLSASHLCGETVTLMSVYTGRTYSGILALPTQCVYRKEDGRYYVRVIVDETAIEKTVTISLWNGFYYSVTGVEETDLCDSGYKAAFGLEG